MEYSINEIILNIIHSDDIFIQFFSCILNNWHKKMKTNQKGLIKV